VSRTVASGDKTVATFPPTGLRRAFRDYERDAPKPATGPAGHVPLKDGAKHRPRGQDQAEWVQGREGEK